MSKMLIIVPAFNEGDNILAVCRHLKGYKFIVINDASTDNTEQILNDHHIPHLTHPYNLGIGGAMQTGYRYAALHHYDIAVQFDGDGQHDAKYITTLVNPIKKGTADMVIGSRFLTDASKFKSSCARRFGIKIISICIRLTTGRHITDTTSGFRAVNAAVLSRFAQYYPTEYPEPISTALCLKDGFRVTEVPVSMNARAAGHSSIHGWKNFYYMFNVMLSLLAIKIRRVKK